MFIKKLGFLLFSFILLNGCGGQMGGGEWGTEWSNAEPNMHPNEMASESMYDYGVEPAEMNELKTVAVLLPLAGPNGNIGIGIQHSIEIAFFQKQPKNIMVSFHDIGGANEDKKRVMEMVLSSNPNLIIGPIFAEDAIMLKDMKPKSIPALTFTSAKQALGNGIFTMALLPNQAIETIVKQISIDDREKLLLLAPNTPTGYMLANTAKEAAKIYEIETVGLYFYDENNTDNMKDLAEKVSFYSARVNNLVNAKEILSDVLINQHMNVTERESVKMQLEELNKRDSLGEVPFDSVLFLSNAADSKTLGAYLRYYDVSTGTQFYGSALWDAESVWRDSSLAGGEYAGLPRISDLFVRQYSEIEGTKPNRFNTVGYDAAMLAIKALNGSKPVGAYLLDPSGYKGLDGVVRLRPNGENERALQIMQLNGVSFPYVKKQAPQNFINPIYKTTKHDLDRPAEKQLVSHGYDPIDYIKLPEHIMGKYKSKNYDIVSDTKTQPVLDAEHIEVQEDNEAVIDSDFKPSKPATVDKKLINEVKMKAN